MMEVKVASFVLLCVQQSVTVALASPAASPASYTPLREGMCDGSAHNTHLEGFVITSGGLSVSFCNSTAWTFRDLNFSTATPKETLSTTSPILTPTGFAQVVSNVRVAPNESSKLWPPLHPVVCPVVPRGPNGPPAPGASEGSGFLGTGHGGEYVFGLELVATPAGPPERMNLLGGEALPLAKVWPSGAMLQVEKHSQIGPFEVQER